LDDVIFRALLLVILLEKKESEGKVPAFLKYHDGLVKKNQVKAMVTSLESLLDQARIEEF
jgi:hypothetical protein